MHVVDIINIYVHILLVNFLVYIVAWIFCGGPGFVSINNNDLLRTSLLIFYFIWLIGFAVISSVEIEMKQREEN